MQKRVLLILLALAACQPSPTLQTETAGADVLLNVAPAEVAPGDTVVLTLRNESANAIGYNLCTSGLQRQSGADWEPVPSDRVCTMELRTLQPAAQDDFPLQLPDTLPAGEYRFHTTVEIMGTGERRDVTSHPFRVER